MCVCIYIERYIDIYKYGYSYILHLNLLCTKFHRLYNLVLYKPGFLTKKSHVLLKLI